MWRSSITYGLLYMILFTSHIWAAANDYDILFRLIAILITFQTMSVGFILHKLCLFFGERERIIVARIACIFLSGGLGWAYADMTESWTILLWISTAILIQLLSERAFMNGVEQGIING